ncbi:hypothetical protein QT23_00050, partial [Staphylococcus aureus]
PLVMVGHRTFEVIGVHIDNWGIDRQLLEVGPNAVALCVLVSEVATQQHLVGRHAHAGHHFGRRECGLLDLGEEVFRVAVELHRADFDARVILL